MKRVLKLSKFDNNGKIIWTLNGLCKPLEDYRKSVRKAIGFMNEHRPGSIIHPEGEYHDDGSPEYYIRRDLCDLAWALEKLAGEF